MMGLAGSDSGRAQPDSTSTVRLTPAGRNSGTEKRLLALPAPTENKEAATHCLASVPVDETRARAAEDEPGTEPLQPKVRVPPEASTSADKPSSEPPLTELEQKAFDKLQKRAMENKAPGTGSRGRGSGRGRGCGKGRGRGRAAAKGSQDANSPGASAAAKPRKRPAAAISSARPWLVQKPTAKQRASSKESYISTQYHQAKQHALRELGCDEVEAKEYGRRAYNEAKGLW